MLLNGAVKVNAGSSALNPILSQALRHSTGIAASLGPLPGSWPANINLNFFARLARGAGVRLGYRETRSVAGRRANDVPRRRSPSFLTCGASHKAQCGGRLQDDLTQFEDFVIRDLVLARLV